MKGSGSGRGYMRERRKVGSRRDGRVVDQERGTSEVG